MQYRIDPAVSRFTIRAFTSGLLSALGHSPTFAVRTYDGVVQFDPEEPTMASLTLRILAASLDLVEDVSRNDRREILRTLHDEVLEDQKYPTIEYEAPPPAAMVTKNGDGQFTVRLNGMLTLHNVTRPQAVSGHLAVSPGMLRAYGDFSVKQSDYGIPLVSAVAGTIKLKDELKCTYDLVGRQ